MGAVRDTKQRRYYASTHSILRRFWYTIGTVSLQELSDALQKDSALARMLNLAEHHDTQTKALAEETDANLTREDVR